MAEEKTVFESLSNVGESFDSKSGKNFRASFRGFVGKDAEIRPAGDQFVVATFTNISGSIEVINSKLGTSLQEDPEYHNIAANVSWFTNTKQEAEALASHLVKGAQIMNAPVVLSTHEYQEKTYLDMRIDTPYIAAPKNGEKATSSESPFTTTDDTDFPM